MEQQSGGKIIEYFPTKVKQTEQVTVLCAPGCQVLDLTRFTKCQTTRNQPAQTTAISYASAATKGLQNENKENEIKKIPEPEEEHQSRYDEMIAPSPSKKKIQAKKATSRKTDRRRKGKQTKGKNDTIKKLRRSSLKRGIRNLFIGRANF
ncbi:hypothetical protein CHS0354_009334 [Potamilus streckersoni]|uniref:Uncharacterized protein n=1 Tax=Potamilus streckersoni TaxID=2493646 RepID=A0AAE0VZH9_9BIVA|nr:hypothetical protein CHS0354_009334 [Potamilus streckersoni]